MTSCTYQWKVRLPLLFVHLATLMISLECYQRPPARKMIHTPLPNNYHPSSPQQVHISLAGENKMRVSWVTHSKAPSVVFYRISRGSSTFRAEGRSTIYTYASYTSGFIHHVVIGPLKPATVYYYTCGIINGKQYSFGTPPAKFPINFAIAGDLGQTEYTRSTLSHISRYKYDVLLLPGDLSYADRIQPKWDSFGRLVEPLASQRPWMVAVGNHEPETIPLVHKEPFTAYNARWQMPFKESKSPSNLYYSFDVAGVHVTVLSSYSKFDRGSIQYRWFVADLNSVDRFKTPWLVVIIHAPWYNTNAAHQGERASVEMKASMERVVRRARVDIVFAGHVHAYERFTRVYNDRADKCGPVHITIGDGGNWEGLAMNYITPRPRISIFREASFGHGRLIMVNETHAKWKWHRNEDAQTTVADSIWLKSLVSNPACN